MMNRELTLLVVVVVDRDVIAGHELRGEEAFAHVRCAKHEDLKQSRIWEKINLCQV